VPDAGFATNLNMTLQLEYFDRFLRDTGDETIDRVAYHMYIDGGNNPQLEPDLTSPTYLDHWDPLFPSGLLEVAKRRTPKAAMAGLWADEIAAAWGSCGGGGGGGAVVCNRFMDGYWYIHQLGTLSLLGHTLFARQTLRGGWYELLNQTNSEPHPDFYVALMWKRFMSLGDALGVSVDAVGGDECASKLRAFASSTPPPLPSGGARGDVGAALALVNFCQSSSVSISIGGGARAPVPPSGSPSSGATTTRRDSSSQRHDYIFTPCSGDLHDSCVALGGERLRLGAGGALPDLRPSVVDAASPLVLPAGAFAWSVFL
jgi:hypothetical protein